MKLTDIKEFWLYRYANEDFIYTEDPSYLYEGYIPLGMIKVICYDEYAKLLEKIKELEAKLAK